MNASAKPSLTLKRKFNVAPALVYAAWTEPAHLLKWFGPEGAEVVTAETDVRVGGRYHIVFTTPDGEEHDVSGSYDEAARDRHVWGWTGSLDKLEAFLAIHWPGD